MKVTSFSKQNLPEIRKQMNEKLNELKALGLDIKVGNINFTSSSFTAKIECRLENALDVYAEAFDQSFESRNLKNAVGTPVTFMGKVYIFKGFKPKARVKQAIVERDNKQFRIEFSAIRSQLL